MSPLIERAGAWFLHSGIQEPSGGVARYYRSDLQTNAPISTEITGYAVSTFAWLHQRTGDSQYRDAAIRAANFLIHSAWDRENSIFPFEYPSNGLAYFFDCGIILRALLAAARLNQDPAYLSRAVQCGRCMLSDFCSGETTHARITTTGKRPLPPEPRWSASPGCYQLKAALAWHELAQATGNLEFQQAYERFAQQAIEDAQTFLPGAAQPEKVMDRLHAFCYFLEGLSPLTHREDCAAAYRTGLDRLARHLREIEPEFVRSDVYAQLLRARVYGPDPIDETAAAHEAAQAASFQLTSTDPRINGGFAFGRKCGAQLPYVNPVSTAFCAQSLTLWSDYQRDPLI